MSRSRRKPSIRCTSESARIMTPGSAVLATPPWQDFYFLQSVSARQLLFIGGIRIPPGFRRFVVGPPAKGFPLAGSLLGLRRGRGGVLGAFNEIIHAVTLAFDDHLHPAMNQSVHGRRAHERIAEDRGPFGEITVGGNDRGSPLVAIADDLIQVGLVV